METKDFIKLTILSVSLIDFFIFTGLFVMYLLVVQFKTKKTNEKIGSIIVLLFFLVFKTLHIPVFLAYLSFLNIRIPHTDYILICLVWVNVVLALGPVITAVITFIKNTKNNDEIVSFDNHINIIMPIYNETQERLLEAIESVKNVTYDYSKIHLFLSFDDTGTSPAYNALVSKWLLEDSDFIEINDKIKISICRFKHGGKKSAQEGALKKIKEKYSTARLNNSYLFFIDSDVILKKDCIYQFIKYMTKTNKNSLTGMITCITSKKNNFLSYYQDIEYVSGQIFWRNMEDFFKATSCLPGAFTFMKWKSFKLVEEEYFSEKEYKDTFDYHRFYLGEDRYLTHLLMQNDPSKIGFCEKARCKTNAPGELSGLLKQRRRWFLGHISNDTWLISSVSLWKTYPLFSLFNFLNNSRNTSIYVYLLYFLIFFNNNIPFILWFLQIILPIIIYWSLIIYYSFSLKRQMNILFYIMIIALQPIFNMLFMYYTIYNFKKRSWGGIRVKKTNDV